MTVQVFTPLFAAFDAKVQTTIDVGSANIATLITPVIGAAFCLYVSLIALAYWNGNVSIGVGDLAKRLIAWAVIITLGLNISYYSQYVVPFFNGIGDDIANALTGTSQTGSALDGMIASYVTAIKGFYRGLGMLDVLPALEAVMMTMLIALTALPFLAIAAAYIILAKFALAVLLALGPLFISLALFPATRRFFDAWVGQCISYALLTALFAAVASVEVSYATDALKSLQTASGLANQYATYLEVAFAQLLMGIVFIIISLNMPSLASQLSGGVGISSMVGKLGTAARGGAALARMATGVGNTGAKGGGGSMVPESKGS